MTIGSRGGRLRRCYKGRFCKTKDAYANVAVVAVESPEGDASRARSA